MIVKFCVCAAEAKEEKFMSSSGLEATEQELEDALASDDDGIGEEGDGGEAAED